MIQKNDVINLIGNIKDPDLGLTLNELNAIQEVEILNEKIQIKLNLIQPIYWVAKDLNELINAEYQKLNIELPLEVLISEVATDTATRPFLPNVKNIIAVASGKGGVGKSSIAANITLALAESGAKVGILDGDVYGPSQPTMFGLKNAKLEAFQKEDGTTSARPTSKYGVQVASMGFVMNPNEAAIVRGPMLAGYFSMLFEQIFWGTLDFLVFDLPPGTGDIQLTLTQKIPLTGAVVITTPQEISLADVRRSIAMFEKVNVNVIGIVENMSYFIPDDMPDKKYYIFGKGGGEEICKEYNLDLLGQVPLDINMRDANDSGTPVVIKHPDSPPSKEIFEITKKMVSKIRVFNYKKSQEGELEINL